MLVLAGGRVTAVSCVVVVVLVVTGWSWAHEARKRAADTENSEVRIVNFFIVKFSFQRESSQVPRADVLSVNFVEII